MYIKKIVKTATGFTLLLSELEAGVPFKLTAYGYDAATKNKGKSFVIFDERSFATDPILGKVPETTVNLDWSSMSTAPYDGRSVVTFVLHSVALGRGAARSYFEGVDEGVVTLTAANALGINFKGLIFPTGVAKEYVLHKVVDGTDMGAVDYGTDITETTVGDYTEVLIGLGNQTLTGYEVYEIRVGFDYTAISASLEDNNFMDQLLRGEYKILTYSSIKPLPEPVIKSIEPLEPDYDGSTSYYTIKTEYFGSAKAINVYVKHGTVLYPLMLDVNKNEIGGISGMDFYEAPYTEPGDSLTFVVVYESFLGEEFSSSSTFIYTAKSQSVGIKKIIDVALGQVAVENTFEGLTPNVEAFEVKGRLPVYYVNTSVVGVGLILPKLISSPSEMVAFVKTLLMRCVEQGGNGNFQTEYITNLLNPLMALATQTSSPYYICGAPYGSESVAGRSMDEDYSDYSSEAADLMELKEEIFKEKNIKFLVNLASSAGGLEPYFELFNSTMENYSRIYIASEPGVYKKKTLELTDDFVDGWLSKKLGTLETTALKADFTHVNCADYIYPNCIGISEEEFTVPVLDFYGLEICSLINTFFGCKINLEKAEDYIVVYSREIVLPILTEQLYKQYNGEVKNELVASMELTFKDFKKTYEKPLKKLFVIKGMGEKYRSVADDICGYNMTSITKCDDGINTKLTRVLMKTEHSYYGKDVHVKMGVLKVDEVVWSVLEKMSMKGQIKESNLGAIKAVLTGPMNKMLKDGTYKAYEFSKFAFEDVEKNGALVRKLVIIVKLYFAIGAATVTLENNYSF